MANVGSTVISCFTRCCLAVNVSLDGRVRVVTESCSCHDVENASLLIPGTTRATLIRQTKTHTHSVPVSQIHKPNSSRVNPRIDPRAEITRIRNSLLVIENHINRTSPGGSGAGSSGAGNALLTRSDSSDEGGSAHSRRGSVEVANVMGSFGSQSISPTSLTSEAGSGGLVLRLPDDPAPGSDLPNREVEVAGRGGATPFIGSTSVASTLRILSAFVSIPLPAFLSGGMVAEDETR